MDGFFPPLIGGDAGLPATPQGRRWLRSDQFRQGRTSRIDSPAEAGLPEVVVCLSASRRILTGVLGRRLGVALARS